MRRIIEYLRFFFYVSVNWNIWLAFFMLYHDVRGAWRYGAHGTFIPEPLHRLTIQQADISNSSPYEAVNFYMLEKLLGSFRQMTNDDAIVDLGCGKGRVLIVAAHYGFKKLTGIDFASELCREAVSNMRAAATRFPGLEWQVFHSDVLEYEIRPLDNVFFMFNPFGEATISRFVGKLDHSCKMYPRKTWFIYASPRHAGVLLKRGFKQVYSHQLMNLSGCIMCR